MADFLTNLWESVFTPGTTPTLLIATNVTFAVLQLLLGILLVATYSIHFFILSFLSGGLWYAINWFAHEVRQAQAQEAEAKRLHKSGGTQPGDLDDLADDEGDETEVETSLAKKHSQPPAGTQASQNPPPSSGVEAQAASNSRRRQPAVSDDISRGSDVSTDSEWEKVDG